jgi:hypothetical protein
MENIPDDQVKKLLANIRSKWEELIQLLGQLTQKQIITIKDGQNWTIKDHVNHIMAWERSVVYFLSKKPRFEGLGIEKEIYLHGSIDEINNSIFQKNHKISPENAMAQFRENHETLMGIIQSLNDGELHQTYSQYLPEEKGDTRLVYDVIHSNTIGHYEEHIKWITELIGK